MQFKEKTAGSQVGLVTEGHNENVSKCHHAHGAYLHVTIYPAVTFFFPDSSEPENMSTPLLTLYTAYLSTLQPHLDPNSQYKNFHIFSSETSMNKV